MKERYPKMWESLQTLNIGVNDNTSSMETIELLLDYIAALHKHIDHLEIEKDLS